MFLHHYSSSLYHTFTLVVDLNGFGVRLSVLYLGSCFDFQFRLNVFLDFWFCLRSAVYFRFFPPFCTVEIASWRIKPFDIFFFFFYIYIAFLCFIPFQILSQPHRGDHGARVSWFIRIKMTWLVISDLRVEKTTTAKKTSRNSYSESRDGVPGPEFSERCQIDMAGKQSSTHDTTHKTPLHPVLLHLPVRYRKPDLNSNLNR